MKLPNFDLFGLGGENNVESNNSNKEQRPPFAEQVRTFVDRIKTKLKKKKKSTIVILVILGVMSLYLLGIITTFVRMFGSLSNGFGAIKKPSFNPLDCFLALFDVQYSIWAMLIFLLLVAAGLFWYIRNTITLGQYSVETRSGAAFKKQIQDATLGSAREMTEEEMTKEFLIVSKSELEKNNPNTIIYGIHPETGDYVMQKPKPSNAPDDWAPNLSMFVCGDAGSYKTSNCIIPAMKQICRARKNIICTDLSGECFKLTYNDFKEAEYNIRVFNTISPEHSDTWNFIGSVGQNIDLAKTITQTIQQATELPNSRSDEFFTRGMNTLLPALILYVNEEYSGFENSIKGIMQLIMNNNTVDRIKLLFDSLDDNSEAKIQYTLFEVCPVKENFLANLAQRLDLFVSRGISRICSANGINLVEELGRSEKPTVIYVITSQTYAFISALFLSAATKLLQDYSDQNLKDHVIPNSLYFVYEEFINQGYVPNMVYNMQNLRKYQIYFFIVVQSIPSFEEIYGENEADAILENCKYKLLFGAGGPRTAEKFEKFCGPATVRTEMTQSGSPIIKTSDQVREGIQQRSLYDYNELMTFALDEYLLFVTHCHPLRLKKPYYKFLPGTEKIEESFFMEYTPQSSQQLESKKTSDKMEAIIPKNEKTTATKPSLSEQQSLHSKTRGRKPRNISEEDYTTNLLNLSKEREACNKEDVYRKATDGKVYFIRRDSHNKELLAFKVTYDIPIDVKINGKVPDNIYVTYHSNIDLYKLRAECQLCKEGYLLNGWRMIRSLDFKTRDYIYDENKTGNRFTISVPQSDITIQPLFKEIPGAAVVKTETINRVMPQQDDDAEDLKDNDMQDDLKKIKLNSNTTAFDL